MKSSSLIYLFILCLLSQTLFNGELLAQNNGVRISPKAMVKQKVGFTDVTIDFSRPGVKERKIWGGLVPYNKVWRAGANEATTITFSDDVIVNRNSMKAGKYGFFAIPAEDKEAVLNFGIEFAYRQCRDLLEAGVPGVHIYTMDRSRSVKEIVTRLRGEGLI